MKRIGLSGSCAASLLAAFASGRAIAEGPGSERTYQYVLSTSDRGADLTHIVASYPHQAWLREPPMLVLEGADPTRRFRPGEVSLEQLRRKCPPLNPESTLIGPESDAQDSDDAAEG